MAEYIERRTASNKLYDVYEYVKRNIIADGKPVDASLVKNIMLRFEKALNNVPPADVAPVVHGRWVQSGQCNHKPYRIRNTDKWTTYKCSVCGYSNGRRFSSNYCPNCGAHMKDGE